MANYPQDLAQNAVCQSHTGHMTGLWFLQARPLRLNTNEWMNRAGSSKRSPSLRFPHQNPVYASPLPHTLYMPRPSHSSRTILSVQYRSLSSSCSFHTECYVNQSIKYGNNRYKIIYVVWVTYWVYCVAFRENHLWWMAQHVYFQQRISQHVEYYLIVKS